MAVTEIDVPILDQWADRTRIGARFPIIRQPSASFRAQHVALSDLRQFFISGDAGPMTDQEAHDIWDMLHQQRGGGVAALIRPPRSPWRGATGVILGTGDGTEQQWQIVLPHSHGVGGAVYNHPVNYFVSEPKVYFNDVEQTLGVGYTRTLGVITTETSAQIKVDFQHLYPCTLDDDQFEVEHIGVDTSLLTGVAFSEWFDL